MFASMQCVTDIDPTHTSTEEDDLDQAWRDFTQAFASPYDSRPEEHRVIT
jgi:hypothetical protein